jgi:hypothetical protein
MGGRGPAQVRGASAVARQALAFRHRARHARVALVDGSPALVVTVKERVVAALTFTFARNLIAGVDVIGDPDTLGAIASGTRPDPADRQPEM